MSHVTQHYTSEMFEVFASLSETFVFAYLGMAIFSIDQTWDPALIPACIFICLVARAIHVFPLCSFVNIFRVNSKIPGTHMFVIWFAGLRGALAFALSLNVPTTNGAYILSTTLGIVLFTVLILGGFTTKLLQLMHVKTGLDPDLADMEDKDDKGNRFYLLDRYYLKPLFTIAYEPRLIPVNGMPEEHDHDDHNQLFVGKNPNPQGSVELSNLSKKLVDNDELKEQDNQDDEGFVSKSGSLADIRLDD